MKNVILSADGDRMVWSVPDVVAANLEEYCMEFCCRWLRRARMRPGTGPRWRVERCCAAIMNPTLSSIWTNFCFPASPVCLWRTSGI